MKSNRKVNILGVDYELMTQKISDNPKLKNNSGLCEIWSKKIIIEDVSSYNDDPMTVENPEDYVKKVTRHEIIHAFFAESGLDCASSYANNEELIDWIAMQIPKMAKVMNEIGVM